MYLKEAVSTVAVWKNSRPDTASLVLCTRLNYWLLKAPSILIFTSLATLSATKDGMAIL
jgi:hypothetical protein